jgi:hypothetical protein
MIPFSIQYTIYLYWVNYKEFSKIEDAVKFAQSIYTKEHRYVFQLLEKYRFILSEVQK